MNSGKKMMSMTKKGILMFAVLGMSFVFLSACNKQVETGGVEENKKSDEQTLVEEFAVKIGSLADDVHSTVFKLPSLEGEISEIEVFETVNRNYPRDQYQELEKMFTDWNMYMPADGVGESIVWYLKDDKVCKLHTLLNATIEEIDNDDLEDADYTVSISCGKNIDTNGDEFIEGAQGNIEELQKKLGFDISDGDLTNLTHYIVGQNYKDYIKFSIKATLGGFDLVVKKIGNTYEKVWEGHDVSDADCKRIVKKYPELLDNTSFLFTICKERLVEKYSEKGNLGKAEILKNTLKNFEIQEIEGAIPTVFLWDKNETTYTIDGYKINFKNSDKVFELNTFGWIANTENSTNQEKLVVKGFEKNENVCHVEYHITEGNSKVWAYADITIYCGKLDKNNKVDEGKNCEDFLKEVFYTSDETKEYINILNKQIVKNRDSEVGLIDYVFEQENPELSSGIFYVLKEIHRDSKGGETREVTTRHYKFDPAMTNFYEYDVISDNYQELTTKEKYVDIYKNICVGKNKDEKAVVE